MRHRVSGFKLGRSTPHRKAMWRNMAIALLTHEQITTTIPKAKSVKPFVERLITWAKKGDLASRRRVLQALGNPIMMPFDQTEMDRDELKAEGYKVNRFYEVQKGPRLVKHLFDEIAPRYADRNGGYTRIIKLGTSRLGDGADLCVLQLVGDEEGPQVSGQYSRRREKADRRMAFAAQVRKGAAGGGQSTATTAEAEAREPEQATGEAEQAQPEAQAPQEGEQQQ